ncbi:MAG: hypothetical protein COZ06_26770 [Armatimonadetes bacterium CG_4_10_14_3_um_filter_66_18]|nr:hypothetical protein [Armatimonadota bacterium]OIP01878.1 MAG: hypothetical protein AUJ96_16990 [Armatimonadetes bacterium CG2_30_66_41]PIW15918.1 MAG: hypothetical protein COW34_06215 [Armatimonadetes bacterium CG17_big_fil_post_rev_8_21_14_2_50_66_6]PIX42061.1 MAG: hypothetical protein COZ57_21995 [Armatimonadetes bacterium CG_4_8_14_3_um_filter_66_20]PIY41353.1 MAG: hypothetical protein COZ06_26770 [Armatimonadetes bacterium CG_4_10_14_3_um_filter_66_18]PIZ34572.1 MAG: hypothetical prote
MHFGIATTDISPPFPTTMAGYGARYDHFDDIHDPLTFTALILEERGRRAFIGSADLITFENEHVRALREKIAGLLGAPVDNVLLNASHTHGGPEMRAKGGGGDTSSAGRYQQFLEEQVLTAASAAAADMQRGSLWYGLGKSGTPMNRRLERTGEIVNAPNREGPVDDRAQLLVLRGADGDMRALGLRLSCHPVATGAQHRITADYPGAFRAACRQAFGPGVTPFFLQGAGGDMRPAQVDDGEKWRQLRHDELPVIGEALLADCLRVLGRGALVPVGPLSLMGHLKVAKVPCVRLHAKRGELDRLLEKGDSLERQHAERIKASLDAGEGPREEVDVRVHTLWLTKDFAVVGIQGEVLIGLGACVEKALAPNRVLLLGYTNGCVGYLPDTKELKRGGYEQTSYLYSDWSGPFKPGLERVIAAAAKRHCC